MACDGPQQPLHVLVHAEAQEGPEGAQRPPRCSLKSKEASQGCPWPPPWPGPEAWPVPLVPAPSHLELIKSNGAYSPGSPYLVGKAQVAEDLLGQGEPHLLAAHRHGAAGRLENSARLRGPSGRPAPPPASL